MTRPDAAEQDAGPTDALVGDAWRRVRRGLLRIALRVFYEAAVTLLDLHRRHQCSS